MAEEKNSALSKADEVVEKAEKVVDDVGKGLGLADKVIKATEAYHPDLPGDKAKLQELLKEAETAGAKTLLDVIIHFLQK